MLAAVPYQIISPANNKSIVGIFQDSMLGSYLFSQENINFDKRKAMNLIVGLKILIRLVFSIMKQLVIIIYFHKLFHQSV